MGAAKILLTVAGFDPTSGAGTALDLKVFLHLGYRGTAVLTSATVQNTKGVREVRCLPARFVWEQYLSLTEEMPLSGIKVGMIGCKHNIQPVHRILSSNVGVPRVIDPVFRSSSGTWLLEKEAIPAFINKICSKVSVLTPNLEEASLLSGLTVENTDDMKKASERISALTQTPCLIKGGHLKGRIVDMLFDSGKFFIFEKERLSKDVRGTGCFFSSILLGCLAGGKSLVEACSWANSLTYDAIKEAESVGQGQALIRFPLSSPLPRP
jgi:hydroxymethylpyrimidine kinase/phosphomethylpyrimidine kinase